VTEPLDALAQEFFEDDMAPLKWHQARESQRERYRLLAAEVAAEELARQVAQDD
jgi:hypothetical protein